MGNPGVVRSNRVTITAPSSYIVLKNRLSIEPLVPRTKFFELLDVLDKYINLLRPLRKTADKLDHALSITKEMRFVGLFNHNFRVQTYPQLEELFDDIYFEIHT